MKDFNLLTQRSYPLKALTGFSIGIMLLLLGQACFLAESNLFRELVVERNKEAAPSWVSFSAGHLHWDRDNLTFVFTRKALLDLQLGIKQAQQSGHEAFKRALHTELWQKLASSQSAPPPQSPEWLLHRRIDAAITKQLASAIVVHDIYYEKKRRQAVLDEHSYDVYVLLLMPATLWLPFERQFIESLSSPIP